MATSTCFLCRAGSLDWVTSLTKSRTPGKQAAINGFVMLKERHTSHRLAGPDAAGCAALMFSEFTE
jgi:hypothetical protein